MEKIIFLIAILTTSFTFCQNTFPTNGNVGIGTTSPESGWKLDVAGIATIGGVSGNGRLYVSTEGTTNGYTTIQARNLTIATPLRFSSSVASFDSNVGIGGSSTYGKLQISYPAYATTNNMLALAVEDGTYNPRAVISHTSAIGVPSYVKFDSAYTSGWGPTNWSFASGNVGIGTTSPESGWKLDVAGIATIGGVSGNGRLYVSTEGTTNGYTTIQARNLTIATPLRFSSSVASFDSNVGIGGSSTYGKLQISYPIYATTNNMLALAVEDGTYNPRAVISHTSAMGVPSYVKFDSAYTSGWGATNWSFASGNVGIGTINPTSKLTVAGNISSREVKVTVDAGADFVFKKDYNLPSLSSLDTFIKENKHLPEMASAKEMQANGINLSEMNIKLLQKVEEMTLYMIEMKKDNEKLKINQAVLEKRLKIIENK
jgi:hypothetical protein